MSVYAVGDVQGCLHELRDLLGLVQFDPLHDTLWLVGDLVNRGPDSLGVLRLVRDLGTRAQVVLGNHDLHLIATVLGERVPRSTDSFQDLLEAPDRDQLIRWLRTQPLLHYDQTLNVCMTHAGILPAWDLTTAIACADELQTAIRNNRFCYQMDSEPPSRWSDRLVGAQRLRFIRNVLTGMRYVDHDGALALKESAIPGSQSAGLLPWFNFPHRAMQSTAIVFGHWSTLELGPPHLTAGCNVWPLDTGCVWGRTLTALRLEDHRHFAVPSRQPIPYFRC